MTLTYGLWADEKPEDDKREEQDELWKWLQEMIEHQIKARVEQGLDMDQARVSVHNKLGCTMSLFMLITNKWVLECPDGCRNIIKSVVEAVQLWEDY